jgi:hypothetical protein
LKQYFDFKEKTLLDETTTALSEDDKYNIYKAEKILFGLGFSEEDFQKEPKLIYVNTANYHAKLAMQCFVTLATQI